MAYTVAVIETLICMKEAVKSLQAEEKGKYTVLAVAVILMALAGTALGYKNGVFDTCSIFILGFMGFAAIDDAIYMLIPEIHMMMTLTISMGVIIAKRGITVPCIVIIGVMLFCNIIGQLGFADTIYVVCMIAAVACKGTTEIIIMSLWIATVALAINIIYNKKNGKGDSAAYMHWMFIAFMIVANTYN